MAAIYADHDVSRRTVVVLRSYGHVVITTRDRRQERVPDGLQLLTATQNSWILVSHNAKDYELLHDAWQRWTAWWGIAEPHSGIIIVPQVWHPLRAASEIDAFVESSSMIANELYRWTPRDRWRRHDLRED